MTKARSGSCVRTAVLVVLVLMGLSSLGGPLTRLHSALQDWPEASGYRHSLPRSRAPKAASTFLTLGQATARPMAKDVVPAVVRPGYHLVNWAWTEDVTEIEEDGAVGGEGEKGGAEGPEPGLVEEEENSPGQVNLTLYMASEEKVKLYGSAERLANGEGLAVVKGVKNGAGQVAYAQPLQVVLLDGRKGEGAQAVRRRGRKCLSRPFQLRFGLQVGGGADTSQEGGDGLTFAMLPELKRFGWSGGDMGYGRRRKVSELPSFAIEFDIAKNPDIGDINGNHIGLDFNCSIKSVASSDVTHVTMLGDGEVKHVWIDYDPEWPLILVYVSPKLQKPANPVFQTPLDLCAVLPSPVLYATFSAANGGGAARAFIIRYWEFAFTDGQPLVLERLPLDETVAEDNALALAGPVNTGPEVPAEVLQPEPPARTAVKIRVRAKKLEEDGGGEGGNTEKDVGQLKTLEGQLDVMAGCKGGHRQYSARFNPNSSIPPKFVAIGQLVEQLTKARYHMVEVMAAAKAMNRTLVLPSVGGSHIGMFPICNLPTCTHFDVDVLGEYVDWVTEDYLNEYFVKKYQREPRVYVLFLKFKVDPVQFCELCMRDLYMTKCQDAGYFPEAFADKMAKSVLTKGTIAGTVPYGCLDYEKEREDFQTHVADVRALQQKDDVMVVHKRAWENFFNDLGPEKNIAAKHLTYAKYLVEASARLTRERLGEKYLAVHWRLEKSVEGLVNGQRLQICVDGLIKTARRVMAEHGIKHMFLASDLSLHANGTWLVKSDTFLEEKGQDTINEVTAIMKKLHTSLRPVTWDLYYPGFSSLDTGIQAILDKLQCGQAELFMFGPHECHHLDLANTYQPSSYTRDVMRLRRELGKTRESHIRWTTIRSHLAGKNLEEEASETLA